MTNEQKEAIRQIATSGNFEAVLDLMRGLQESWRTDGFKRLSTIEETGMNTIKNVSKAEAVDDIIANITEITHEAFEKLKGKKHGE